MVSAELLATFRRVLARYGLTGIHSAKPIADSGSNENFRLETAVGPVFLKFHRANRPLERLEREQHAIAWVASRGIPVVAPLAASDGSTLVEHGGRFWSAYRWVEGQTYPRGDISVSQAASLGAVQGMLHRVLAEYPAGQLGPNSELSWDTAASLRNLEQVAPSVERDGTEQERRWLNRQRDLLESGVARGSDEFEMARQPTHGDFHERNVMFGRPGELVAVVDWERFCVQPPAFEVVRAVSFMLLLSEPLLSAYFQGYATEVRLEEATAVTAVEAWWQSSLHNTWAFRDYFLAGNAGARQFLPQEESRSRLFNDPAFRERLAATIIRFAC